MAAETIRVRVVRFSDRENLMLRWQCPATGKTSHRSAGTADQREAERAAAKLEADLLEGRFSRDSRMTWEAFREHWEDARLPWLAKGTGAAYIGAMNLFGELCRPQRLADLTTATVTMFGAELRKPRRRAGTKRGYVMAEATVAKHLRHLKAVARWAHDQELLARVPKFTMPKRGVAAKMKGRPITGEEFDRMIDATERVVGAAAAESWRAFLTGLWWTGLRRGEALALRWDQQPGGVWVVLDGRRSVLAFDAGSQKSGEVELVPLAPEAVEFLAPRRQGSGLVFPLGKIRGEGLMARDESKVGKLVTRIGEAAGVVVDAATGKFASVHDLRRAFGLRWSRRVMPAELMALMRHKDINTTLTYYVGQNAEATAESLWRAFDGVTTPSNKPGNTPSVTLDPAGLAQ